MGGMRFVPKGVTRTRDSTDHPPTWYKVWYQGPESDGQRVLLGRTQRQERHLEHRFFPVDGSWPLTRKGWTEGVTWLMECWRGAKARADACVVTEDEEVHKL
jgi:hypothetical protein